MNTALSQNQATLPRSGFVHEAHCRPTAIGRQRTGSFGMQIFKSRHSSWRGFVATLPKLVVARAHTRRRESGGTRSFHHNRLARSRIRHQRHTVSLWQHCAPISARPLSRAEGLRFWFWPIHNNVAFNTAGEAALGMGVLDRRLSRVAMRRRTRRLCVHPPADCSFDCGRNAFHK